MREFLAHKLRRSKILSAVALLLLASLIPVVSSSRDAKAYGLVQNREIMMSSSARGNVSTGIAPGDDVIYQVSFDVATTGTIQGVVVDFCVDTPIIGDSCTAPSGFNLNHGSLSYTASSGMTNLTHNTTGASSDANTLLLTDATGWSATAGNTATFTLGTGSGDGVTNPVDTDSGTVGDQVGTFYARIVTYTTVAGAEAYTSASPGSEPPVIDAGGVALSTAEQITVTSKVQETLTFCIYTTWSGATPGQEEIEPNYDDCQDVSGTAVNLGDDNGVLSTQGPFVHKRTKYNIATNAGGDNGSGVAATIRIKGDTLQTGSFDIAEIGATATASAATTEQFGFCTYTDPGSADPATLTPAAPYDDTNCEAQTSHTAGTAATGGAGTALFAFDTTNTTSTYGDAFATKSAGDVSTGILAFVGNIANTTEAGIYTTVLTFVATATY